jgi:hypothetical protein
MGQYFQDFCESIINADPSIRFIGIADGHGRILATAERPGLQPLLNQQETEQYAITAATRQYTRIRWQYVLIFTFDVTTENFHEIIMQKIIPLVDKNIDHFFSLSEI